jgi:hypothetical protein
MRLAIEKVFLLGFAAAIFLGCSGCDSSRSFQGPFQLRSLLMSNEGDLTGRKLEFQVRTTLGDPVPWALLSLNWEDGGRITFQTNQDGALSLSFEKDILEHSVTVDVEKRTNVVVNVIW